MPRQSREKKVIPDPPDLPSTFDEPPNELHSGDSWDCVRVGESLDLPVKLADIRLTESVWTGVDLASRRITGFHCRDVVFDHCDLSSALLDGADLHRVRFVGCRLTGVLLSGTKLSDVSVEDCAADLSNFRAADASYLSMERTFLREADFSMAELRNSSLLDSDLSGANFADVRANNLELHGCVLDGIRGAASLTGVRIDLDQVIPFGAAIVATMNVEVGDRAR